LWTGPLSGNELTAELPNGNGNDRPLHAAHRALLIKSLIVTAGTVVLFVLGAPMAMVAIGAAAILLLERIKPDSVYRQVDWSLLVMFAGLFVVVRAFEVHVVHAFDIENWTAIQKDPVGMLSIASAAVSNLVSNVPAVLLFKPVIGVMSPNIQETAWLALAMSSTLAGNLTVLGSVANLIVVENAQRQGITITLGDYCRVGIPVTLLTLLIGVGWLCLGY
jgi:Na+/H+ antiporter NhaD/arsenite permease-like protein